MQERDVITDIVSASEVKASVTLVDVNGEKELRFNVNGTDAGSGDPKAAESEIVAETRSSDDVNTCSEK